MSTAPWRSASLTMGFALNVCLLAGCTAAPSAPLEVVVRDGATGRAVAGAAVFVETPSRDHPFSIASLFGRTGTVQSTARTDSAGTARLAHPGDRPVRVVVVADGYLPAWRFTDERQTAERCDVMLESLMALGGS